MRCYVLVTCVCACVRAIARPVLLQFMHSSVRYLKENLWKELTDDIKAYGVLVGVVDHVREPMVY